jgi:Gpi18-like mannosyltransferase
MNRNKLKLLDYDLGILIVIISIVIAIILRFNLFYFESGDFTYFLNPWYDFILENGRFFALKENFSNYNPPYLYLLVIASYLFPNLPNIWGIKLVSIPFDFFGAFWVYKIVKLNYPKGNKPRLAFIITLFAPTVFINSAYWGQCDMIYTSFLLGCLYFISVNRQILGLSFFAIALSFKLQAIFFIPFLFILFLKNRLKWYSFLIIPPVYFTTLIPAWLAGRPFKELLLIYFNQFDTYNSLTMNFPNLYNFISKNYYNLFSKLGLIFTLLLIIIFSISIYQKKQALTQKNIISIALISTFMMPYFLPKMHDRYLFTVDMISIIYAFYFPKYWFVPIVIMGSSLLSYTDFLMGKRLVSHHVLAVILLALFITLLYHLKKTYFDNSNYNS